MHLSLIIPAYNEERRIGDTLTRALDYLRTQAYAFEVIVVDDGSGDGTCAIVSDLMPAHPELRLESLARNCGKGRAVRTGMTECASGAYRVFFDADSSTPVEDLERLWPRFDDGADIVIGSRALPSSEVELRQAPYREAMGRIFNVLLRSFALTPYKDTQCGFKGFTAAACAILFPRQTIDGFSFDAELLYIAARHGLRIDEVPIHWRNSPQSRVHPLSDSTRMFFDLLAIRARGLLGRYA